MKKILSETNPELREQWHPTKNVLISFDEASQSSSIKVWWRCKNNPPHEWFAKIRSRAISKYGCPFCSGRYVALERSVAFMFPEIASEWHPDKNEGLRSDQVSSTSNKKVWWKCEDGHEWSGNIRYRTSTQSGCPKCASKEKSLAVTHPDLAAEWHPEKNYPITAYDVSHGANKKVWWKCPGLGHEWQSQIRSRTYDNIKCPSCRQESGRRVRMSVALSDASPDLIKEWHPTDNMPLTPDKVFPGSPNKVWWLCSRNPTHVWEAAISNRVKGRGCPHCLAGPSLAEKFPPLVKEWHPVKNGDLKPTDVSYGSARRVWWRCTTNLDHEFESTVVNRTTKGKIKRCPICTGTIVSDDNSLELLNPDIAREWHPSNNGILTPKDVSKASGRKVWWQCATNQSHEWQASVKNRTILKSGCPLCSDENNSRRLHEALLQTAQANADFFRTFNRAIESIRKLSRQQLPKYLHLQQPLFRMLYASTITALETYLCDAFFHKVTSDETLIDKLLVSVKEFKEKKYSINEILDWKNNTLKKVQIFLLEDVVWHNMPKVQLLYCSTLGVSFPEDISQIHKAIAMRHDIVHRNGRSTSNKFHVLTINDIENLLKVIECFVEKIEIQVKN